MINSFLRLGIILFSIQIFAHGEDKLGPNGGYLRMPGAFHTELVPAGKNNFKVYLTDLEWKNPLVRESNVVLKYGTIEAKCVVDKIYYLCAFNSKVDLSKGELVIEATRDKQKGNPMAYPLPLRLPEVKKDKHQHHTM